MVFDEADTQNTNGDNGDSNPGQSGNLFLQENHKQKGADDTGGVFDGVRDGLFQETHTEVGEGHGNDVEQGDRQISQQVHGIIVDILRQQGEDSVGAHDNADPDADLQMRILFVRSGAFFVEQFCSTPKQSSCDGKK